MDKRLAAEMANTEMAEHELHDAGWTFEFDRATRRFGACHFKTRRITLSAELVELNSEDEVMNTIRHEIAHVLAGSRAGHGPAWQRTAREIGCDAKRTHDAEVPEPRSSGVAPAASGRYVGAVGPRSHAGSAVGSSTAASMIRSTCSHGSVPDGYRPSPGTERGDP